MAADKSDDPALGLLTILDEDGRVDPAEDPKLSTDVLLGMYREMRRIRSFDERMIALQRQGRIAFYSPSIGQEAVPVATAFATEHEDWVFPALRESSVMLARGFSLERYVAQVFGSSADVLKGRQMPSHMAASEVNVVSWSSSVATQLPQAVGVAWAAKKKGDGIISIGFVGEGGTSVPDFHSAMNFAAVFRLPCVLVCQNNHWAISTPSSRQTASATFAVKAKAYGMPGVRVDGNDVLAMYKAISDARLHAIAGAGPVFIEAVTYRMGVDSTRDDPTRYQSEETLTDWGRRAPIARTKKRLSEIEAIDDDADALMGHEIDAEISEAIERAEAQPPPEVETLFDDVYETRSWNLEEQLRGATRRG